MLCLKKIYFFMDKQPMIPFQDPGNWMIVSGPTACGKSHWALKEALKIGGIIINADSQQIYRDLPILTAYPSLEDQSLVQHAGYGLYAAHEKNHAINWLDNICKIIQTLPHDQPRFLVGGTGLYLKIFQHGLSPMPQLSEKEVISIRKDLAQWTLEKLRQTLKKEDPIMAEKICPQDRHRIGRALEIKWITQKSLSFWHEQPTKPMLIPKKIQHIHLTGDLDLLYERIKIRLQSMIQQGLWKEIDAFAHHYPVNTWLTLPFQPIGIKSLAEMFQGLKNREETLQELILKIRQYAKRQRTWFQKMKEPSWKIIPVKDI
jgi:tRNA dimethylallyltransferase